MAVTVLETLSREDLLRWREVCALWDVIRAEGMALDQSYVEMAKVITLEYYRFYGDLLSSYGIEGEEADEAKISPITGHIYIGAEE